MAIDPLAQRRRENIAGYVIGMWHVEDLMRAHQLDMRAVEEHLVAPMEGDDEVKAGVREWYAEVIDQMREQGIEKTGHLAAIRELVHELEFLHRTLLDVLDDEDYTALHGTVEADIAALQRNAGAAQEGPVTTCFVAIYGVMLLRTQGREVSKATAEAEQRMRALLDLLGGHYHRMRKLPGVSMN